MLLMVVGSILVVISVIVRTLSSEKVSGIYGSDSSVLMENEDVLDELQIYTSNCLFLLGVIQFACGFLFYGLFYWVAVMITILLTVSGCLVTFFIVKEKIQKQVVMK